MLVQKQESIRWHSVFVRNGGSTGMVDYLKTGVKPLIDAVPEVGAILERYGVGCVQC